jgi:hypothetical protein
LSKNFFFLASGLNEHEVSAKIATRREIKNGRILAFRFPTIRFLISIGLRRSGTA